MTQRPPPTKLAVRQCCGHNDIIVGSPADGALQLEEIAVDVAKAAAKMVGGMVGRSHKTSTKSTPTDVVTQTDMEAEMFIREQLTARMPGSAFAGEELEDRRGSNGVGWVIDPIDGTVNFLRGLPLVSVSIGATLDGAVVAGAVAAVFQDETYSAAEGTGARLNGRPISVASHKEFAESLLATGFSYSSARRADQGEVIRRLLPMVGDIRCFGSAALHLCWVASGRLDGYFERDLKYWDFAAGALIATESGATVESPVAGVGDLVIAATPNLFERLRHAVG